MKSGAARRLAMMVLASSIVGSSIGHAQSSNAAADGEVAQAQKAMARVAFLVGEWEGEGWIIRGPEGRTAFRQKENITLGANGTAITLRGEGSVLDSASGRWQVVFEAGGLLTYDAAEKRYKMLNAGGNGRALSLEPEIRDNGMTWGFDLPGSRIRYVISHPPDGSFTEIGEMSADDGATWRQFFYMKLHRR
jgi:hypothetical protein